jgi:hypothetical protein
VRVRFLAEAEDELDEAVTYYNALTAELGVQFALEVQEGLKRVTEFPDAWHLLGRRVRRYRLKHFPYGIVYAPLPSEIAVVAIMNLRRKPNYWTKRLGQV